MMLNSVKQLLALSVLLPWALTAAAAGTHSEGAAERLSDLLRDYGTFQASFTQEVADDRGLVVQETEGKLRAKRPGLFYWETRPPANQFIVSDGKTVEVYDPDLEQVTVQELDEQVSVTPALLLSGEVEDLSDVYRVDERVLGEFTRVYILEPKSEDSLFISLTLVFFDGELQEMELEDSLAQRTLISFGGIVLNEDLPDSAFRLDYPEGVDVIKGLQ